MLELKYGSARVMQEANGILLSFWSLVAGKEIWKGGLDWLLQISPMSNNRFVARNLSKHKCYVSLLFFQCPWLNIGSTVLSSQERKVTKQFGLLLFLSFFFNIVFFLSRGPAEKPYNPDYGSGWSIKPQPALYYTVLKIIPKLKQTSTFLKSGQLLTWQLITGFECNLQLPNIFFDTKIWSMHFRFRSR